MIGGEVGGDLDSRVHLEVEFPLPDVLGAFDTGTASKTTCDTALDRVLERQGRLNFISK
jgi:hypothetical protein